eukprot:5832069-Amphidinium_carterae.1
MSVMGKGNLGNFNHEDLKVWNACAPRRLEPTATTGACEPLTATTTPLNTDSNNSKNEPIEVRGERHTVKAKMITVLPPKTILACCNL